MDKRVQSGGEYFEGTQGQGVFLTVTNFVKLFAVFLGHPLYSIQMGLLSIYPILKYRMEK